MTTELNTDIETQISKDEKHAYEWKNATDKLSNLTNKTVTKRLEGLSQQSFKQTTSHKRTTEP